MTPFNPTLDLTLTRLFAAPPAVVWRCWTDPALLCQWWTPKPVITRDVVINPVAGGRFFTLMVMPDGTEMPNEGSFLEAVPQQRLVFTDLLTEGWCPVDAPGLGFTAVITFAPEAGGTRYTALARHRTPEQAKNHSDMGFHDGWGTVATQLDGFSTDILQNQTLTIARTIKAPVDAVWRAWTDPTLLPRWFGPQGYSCVTKEIDLRPGGQWRFDMIGPDGTVWANRHRFALHDTNRRILFLLDDDGTAPAVEVCVDLVPDGAGTRLTQIMMFPNAEMKQGAEGFGAVELGHTTLAKLAALVEG